MVFLVQNHLIFSCAAYTGIVVVPLYIKSETHNACTMQTRVPLMDAHNISFHGKKNNNKKNKNKKKPQLFLSCGVNIMLCTLFLIKIKNNSIFYLIKKTPKKP